VAEATVARLPIPEQIKPGASVSGFAAETGIKKSQYCVLPSAQNNVFKPIYHANNVKNEQQALYARVLKETPAPNNETLTSFITFFKRNLNKVIPYRKIEGISFNEYIKNTNASPSVKVKLKNCQKELDERGITPLSKLTSNQLYRYTKRSAFVKVENLLWSGERGEKAKAPRLIQGATPEFICLVGPYINALQRYMTRRLDGRRGFMMTSSRSTLEVGKFLSSIQGRILENDVSSWDASLCPELCALEAWVLTRYKAPRAVVDLVKANVMTHGRTLKGLKYKVPGTRKSGDPFTTLFNSLLNVMMHYYVLTMYCGVDVNRPERYCRMAVQGDDNITNYVGSKGPFARVLLELGFKSESIFRRDLLESEFCSHRFVECDQGITLIPKLGRVMAKLGCFINPPKQYTPVQLLKGVAMSNENLLQVPGFRTLYEPFLMSDVKAVMPDYEPWKMRISEVTNVKMPLIYGLGDSNFDSAAASMFDEKPNAYARFIMDIDSDAVKYYS